MDITVTDLPDIRDTSISALRADGDSDAVRSFNSSLPPD